MRTRSPGKEVAAGTLLAWREGSVGALGAAAKLVFLQQGARESAGPSALGRSDGQQQLAAERAIHGQKK
jgi:hypothetical protein